MKLEFPNIKLPHFSVKPAGWKIGDLLKGSIPSLGIEWYAKAVNEPMVMASPTIFGYNPATGNLLGGGEAGSEMIGGTNTVMNMIQNAVDKSMQAMNLNALAAAIEDLASRPIGIDINGRQFALATAGDSDRVNGMRNRIIERGVLLD